MFCYCQKSQVMKLMDDMILLAASPRTTGRKSTGMTGSICSTPKFPPAKISLKDFPSMWGTSTPTHSSGGKRLRVGILWLNIACIGYKRRSLRLGRHPFLKVEPQFLKPLFSLTWLLSTSVSLPKNDLFIADTDYLSFCSGVAAALKVHEAKRQEHIILNFILFSNSRSWFFSFLKIYECLNLKYTITGRSTFTSSLSQRSTTANSWRWTQLSFILFSLILWSSWSMWSLGSMWSSWSWSQSLISNLTCCQHCQLWYLIGDPTGVLRGDDPAPWHETRDSGQTVPTGLQPRPQQER